MSAFTNRWSWYYGLSAYWFATSAKWFILLLVVLPGQVRDLVPGGEKGSTWGTVVMIGACWGVFGPSLFGFLTDRLEAKVGARSRMIGIAAAATCIALIMLYGARSVPMIIIGYLLLQVADDLGQGPYQAMIPDLVPAEHRGQASAAYGVMTSAAQVAIALYAQAVGKPELIYIGLGVIHILAAIIVQRTVAGAVSLAPAASETKVGFFAAWREPWRDRDFFWVWFTRFLNAFGFYIIVTYIQYFLQDVVVNPGPDAAKAAGQLTQMIALIIAVTGIVGALVSSRMKGRKRTVRMSGYIMLVAIVLFIFVHQQAVLLGAAAVFGIGYGMYLSADWALVSDVLPDPNQAGAQMGVWSMASVAPQIISGGLGFGIEALNRSLGKGQGYTIAFTVAAVAFLLSTELVVKVRGST
ncbi:MAG: MFS transporter [Chthonomonas sp.]|nr:MFS transporter [Chthonomonas sp.]